jgi:hypothetical protein
LTCIAEFFKKTAGLNLYSDPVLSTAIPPAKGFAVEKESYPFYINMQQDSFL